MAVVMEMHWPEVTTDMYDQALKGVRWEEERPEGALFHVAWIGDDGFHVVDVWQSEQHFNTFVEQRLMPVVKGELNFPGDPKVNISPAHRWFDAIHGDTGS
jgi:hypothetical protein